MKCPACKGRFTSFDRQRGLSVHVVCNMIDPNCCQRCGEPLTKVTKGNIRCKCDQPYIPKSLINNNKDDRPSAQVRYGN